MDEGEGVTGLETGKGPRNAMKLGRGEGGWVE